MHHLQSHFFASFFGWSEEDKGFFRLKRKKNGRKKVKEFFAVTHINTRLVFSHVTLDFSYIDILLINLHIPTKGTESTSEVIFQFNSKIWSLMSLSLMRSQI